MKPQRYTPVGNPAQGMSEERERTVEITETLEKPSDVRGKLNRIILYLLFLLLLSVTGKSLHSRLNVVPDFLHATSLVTDVWG